MESCQMVGFVAVNGAEYANCALTLSVSYGM
jgi:hypothetical protein